MSLDTISVFTDAGTSAQMNTAIGTFLCLDQSQLQKFEKYDMAELYCKTTDLVVYQQYITKKSTWAEIKTAIDALNFIHDNLESINNVEIYTDCQSLYDLLCKRKESLLKNNFITRTGKILNNVDLYKTLYLTVNNFQIKVFKVKGHVAKSHRVSLQEKIFSVVDHLTRKKLRDVLATQKYMT